jgi:hypothetical protein
VIIDQSDSSVFTISKEIASAVGQQLTIVAESICAQGAMYSYLLLSNTKTTANIEEVSIFEPQPYYREYKFIGDCQSPDCPSDYGSLSGRSRFPDLPGFKNGSLSHSSIYLYSSYLSSSIRNDQQFNESMTNSKNLNQMVHGLTYEDSDLSLMYQKGPSTTVMFYLSAKIVDDVHNDGYLAVHRRFPGTIQNNSNYIPYNRQWFTHAPTSGVYLYGPYKETFTKQLVITLSTKTILYFSSSSGFVPVVNAAVMLLSDMEEIVKSVNYPNNGFGAIIKYSSSSTPTVIVWKNNSISPFDETTQTFRTIDYFDANLAMQDLTTESTFTYTDVSGVSWVVGCVPFFDITDSLTSSGADYTSPGLVMLVFSEEKLVNQPWISVQDNISTTTYSVTIRTIIIACVIIGVDLLLIVLFVYYLVRPLDYMTRLSNQVVRLSAEDEDNKDYSAIIDKASLDSSRSDEMGVLAIDYFNVICFLHNRNVLKKNTPKFTQNPFGSLSCITTWEEFVNDFRRCRKVIEPVNGSIDSGANKPISVPVQTEAPQDFDLDVLGSMTRNTKKPIYQVAPTSDVRISIDQDNNETSSMEMGYLKQGKSTTPSAPTALAVEGSRKGSDTHIVFAENITPMVGHKVGYFTSVKTILNLFSLIVLGGYLAIMIVTVISLQSEGTTWSDTATVQLTIQEVDTLSAVVSSQSVFVKVFYTGHVSESVFLSFSFQYSFFSFVENIKIKDKSYLQVLTNIVNESPMCMNDLYKRAIEIL